MVDSCWFAVGIGSVPGIPWILEWLWPADGFPSYNAREVVPICHQAVGSCKSVIVHDASWCGDVYDNHWASTCASCESCASTYAYICCRDMHRPGSRAQGIADAIQGWSEAHFLDRQCTWLRAVKLIPCFLQCSIRGLATEMSFISPLPRLQLPLAKSSLVVKLVKIKVCHNLSHLDSDSSKLLPNLDAGLSWFTMVRESQWRTWMKMIEHV